jgi:hypothetical protein
MEILATTIRTAEILFKGGPHSLSWIRAVPGEGERIKRNGRVGLYKRTFPL